MQKISHITIENFKIFGDKITIKLGNPSVLIGPNNSGKTTVIQAIALWSWGVKRWFEKKGNSRTNKNLSTSLSRRDIIQVPVKATRYYWKDAAVRSGNNPLIELKITVGLFYNKQNCECTINFKYYNPEQIYCYPSEDTFKNNGLLKYASSLNVDLLYPMSGIDVEEPLIQEGRINVLIGQGQTAQVLRNLCFKVLEEDKKNNTENWKNICLLMKTFFHVELQSPIFNQTRGSVELTYTTSKSQKMYPLDISLSGRGQQQILLLLAYLYTHKESVLLIDEPDAHLEILRQKQVFSLLKKVSIENSSQIILATHSEVIVDEAIDTNLSLLLNGKSINLSDKSKVKDTLRTFGIEHYYKAELTKSVIYVEGSTDIDMLKEFAKLLNHPVYDKFEGVFYYYYVADNISDSGFEKEIATATGYFQYHVKHFYAIESCVDNFTGIAIFDNDNRGKDDEITPKLATVYWKKYELENYFIDEDTILAYAKKIFDIQYEGLFQDTKLELLKKLETSINAQILEFLFDNDEKSFNDYLTLPKSLKKTTFNALSRNKKMSLFLERVFESFSKQNDQPILLNKGEYYKLIEFIEPDNIDSEIIEKLDLIIKYLK